MKYLKLLFTSLVLLSVAVACDNPSGEPEVDLEGNAVIGFVTTEYTYPENYIGVVTLPIKLQDGTSPSSYPITFDVRATASNNNVDYAINISQSENLKITAGNTQTNFNFVVKDNDTINDDVIITFEIVNVQGATVENGTATVIIEDDDTPVNIDIVTGRYQVRYNAYANALNDNSGSFVTTITSAGNDVYYLNGLFGLDGLQLVGHYDRSALTLTFDGTGTDGNPYFDGYAVLMNQTNDYADLVALISGSSGKDELVFTVNRNTGQLQYAPNANITAYLIRVMLDTEEQETLGTYDVASNWTFRYVGAN